ncbi:MAG: ABC transporter ATP-binding protein [Gloeocapsa sp. DLM2.Bin57]|nr:MAG: ABC transporter ATP-binding protein [Gloeocapsa sp. DLM2.Bin57]
MINYFQKIFYILGNENKRIFLLLVVFIVSSIADFIGVAIIGPYTRMVTEPETISSLQFLNNIFSFLNLQNYNQKLIFLTVVVIAVLVTQVIILLSSQYVSLKISGYLQKKVVLRLFGDYVNVPYKFILSESSASLTNFIQESESSIRGNLIAILQIINNTFMLFAILFILVQTSPTLLVIIIGVLSIVFVVINRLNNKVKQAGKVRVEERKKNISTINHTFGGFKETRVIGCESYFQSQVRQQYDKCINADVLVGIIQQVPGVIIKSSLVIALVIFIGISVTVLEQDVRELTPILGVFGVAGVRVSPAFNLILNSLTMIKSQGYTLDVLYLKLKEIEKLTKEQKQGIENSETHKHLSSSFDELSLVKVDYTYPGSEQPSLQDISFQLKKGESIGIIGKSGAGKTTLIDVILGLLQPDSGDLKVNGVSIYEDLRGWQDILGYIPQTIFLTEDTIEKNIAFGVPEKLIDRERIARVLKMTELEELVTSLPNGVKTQVGERGVRLSGGQRQRVGIARALYHQRQVLVLDEATSALDSQTESLITEAIKSLAGNQTLIIIAHRLSTIRHCDRICLLEKGRLVKIGSYDEVVSEYESRYQAGVSLT